MTTNTLLSLDRFREILGFNPFHFWQLANPNTPLTSQCVPFLRQYAWQFSDAAGRNEIIEVIAGAEKRLTEWLGYSVAPHYVQETLDVGSCFIHSNWFYPQATTLAEGKVQKLATEVWAKVANIPVQSFDTDNDNLTDTFRLDYTDNGLLTDLTELKVYFSSDEQFTDDDLARWEVRPVRFKRISPTAIRVEGRYWLIVRPVLYEGMGTFPGYDSSLTATGSSGSYDPAEPSNFAPTLDIYQRTYTGLNQATLELDNAGTVTPYTLPVTLLDSSTGLVAIGNGCSNLPACSCSSQSNWSNYWQVSPTLNLLPAQRLKINYRAGADIKQWDTAVARYAMAELARPVCGCEGANRELFRWQTDHSETGNSTGGGTTQTTRRVGRSTMDNPFGHRAGHVYAWEQVQHLKKLLGFNAG